MKNKFAPLIAIICVLMNGACSSTENCVTASIPTVALIVPDESWNEKDIQFYENKVKNDAEDFSANNKLAGLYLQKLRETGNARYLELAIRTAL